MRKASWRRTPAPNRLSTETWKANSFGVSLSYQGGAKQRGACQGAGEHFVQYSAHAAAGRFNLQHRGESGGNIVDHHVAVVAACAYPRAEKDQRDMIVVTECRAMCGPAGSSDPIRIGQ